MNTDHTDKKGIINKMKNLCLSVQIRVLKLKNRFHPLLEF
jgi:hypothetical protein